MLGGFYARRLLKRGAPVYKQAGGRKLAETQHRNTQLRHRLFLIRQVMPRRRRARCARNVLQRARLRLRSARMWRAALSGAVAATGARAVAQQPQALV